jgi:hypothetical protein
MGLLAELMRPQAEERAREQLVVKFQLLFDWYEIDRDAPNAWTTLAIFLAMDHVPGMKVIHEPKPRRGRKPSWQAGLGKELVREVEAVQAAKRVGYDEAIKILRSDRTKDWKKFHQASLVTRHREAVRAEKKGRTRANL